jgi:hypothetical protein
MERLRGRVWRLRAPPRGGLGSRSANQSRLAFRGQGIGFKRKILFTAMPFYRLDFALRVEGRKVSNNNSRDQSRK